MPKEIKENYSTCKCGGKMEKIDWFPELGFTTASFSIQRCQKCNQYRKIRTDCGMVFEVLEYANERKEEWGKGIKLESVVFIGNQKEREKWEEELGLIIKDCIFEMSAGSIPKSFNKVFILIRNQISKAKEAERSKILEEVEEEIDKISIDPLREKREGVRGHLLNLFKEKLKGLKK